MIAVVASVLRDVCRKIARCHCGLDVPPPIKHWLPACRASRNNWIPYRSVIAQIVREVRAASGFVEDGDSDMGIEVGKIDYVRAAEKEPKGGVPVGTCAKAEVAERPSRLSASATSSKRVHEERRDGNISRLLEVLLNCECACRKTRVDGRVLYLNVKEETVVQKLLDVKWDLCA